MILSATGLLHQRSKNLGHNSPLTPITLLATESSTYRENPDAPPGSRLSDIALLVNGTDYYHLECQMRNDLEMVIRMIAYDLHFAIQHTLAEDTETGILIMRFAHSAVIYPDKTERFPKHLTCRIIFQDETEHLYQIPAVWIQSCSLDEIHVKWPSGRFIRYNS